MRFALAAVLSLLASPALTACSRFGATTTDAGASPSAGTDAALALSADASPPPPASPIPDEPPPATFREARRSLLTKLDDEPGLAKNADAIRAHFDGGLPPAMQLQVAPLGAGKQALYLAAAPDEAKPMALLVDATGTAIWIRQRPLAGIVAPAGPVAIAPRPDNGVALFLYDAPTKLVAGRMVAPEGAPFAELMLFSLPKCEAISAAWWPHTGWILVASFPGGARAQRVSEDGLSMWAPEAVPVGEPWRATAPATIVIDPTSASWLLVQHATRAGADHVVVTRYSAEGPRLSSTDLGAVPRVADTTARIEATLVRPGIVRVDVAGKAVETRVDGAR